MIWLTWRQFRGQAITALAALAVLTIYLVWLGFRIRNAYDLHVDCTGCSLSTASDALRQQFSNMLLLSGFLVVAVPAIIGAFWGAPLIARELETGTHRLVWSQSVTRTRWLAVKLAFVVLAGVAVTGALSLLLTWAASPYDELLDQRFEALSFPTRNIAPLGYAVFAVVLGTVVGLLTRRTVLAMAITLAAILALQIVVPTVIRPHLQPPVTEAVAFTDDEGSEELSIHRGDGGVTLNAYEIPGAWVLSGRTPLLDTAGDPITETDLTECLTREFDQHRACFAALDLHYTAEYQPADRYWTFQWLELVGYLLLAGLLAGYAFWRIPRGLH